MAKKNTKKTKTPKAPKAEKPAPVTETVDEPVKGSTVLVRNSGL